MGRIEISRAEAILDALSKGAKTREQIDQMINKEMGRQGNDYGNYTEGRFSIMCRKYLSEIIFKVEKSTPDQNILGIDSFVHLKQDFEITRLAGIKLPVQIKSSKFGVQEFKKGKSYLEIHKKAILVINCGDESTVADFNSSMKTELIRVARILPPLMKV